MRRTVGPCLRALKMLDEELSELLKYSWMASRIPVLPALTAFSPEAPEPDPVVTETLRRISGRSRWVVVPGGLRVVMPYHGESFDASRFTVEPGGWDFDTCDVCETYIPAMTLCYSTKPGHPYVLLCAACHERHVASKQTTR